MTIRLNLPANGKRLIHDLAGFGIAEVPYLAAQNMSFTGTSLPLHTHGDRMEINLIIKGERVYRVAGENYRLRGNDVFITWPWEMHGTGRYLHGRGVHFWMQATVPKPGQPFLGYEADRAAPLLRAIWSIPRRQFRADPAMRDVYARMLDICRQGPNDMAGIELSALLIQWFLLLTASAARQQDEEISPDIARALELMDDPREQFSVADLADAACLSESRFKGKFKAQLGVPPGEYLLRRRTELAGDMLTRGGKSLTEIAYEVGFSSSQHFSATFKKFFGMSPNAWLRRQREDVLNWSAPGQTDDSSPHIASPDDVRPWVDTNGVLHGYVPKTYSGVHPS